MDLFSSKAGLAWAAAPLMAPVLLQLQAGNECRLLNDTFAWVVQFVLGFLALLSLLIKRNLEKPRRSWLTFFRDAGKQIVGAAVAHAMNLVLSLALTQYGNECKWYFVNYMVDNLLGMLLNYLFLKGFEAVAIRWTNRLQSGRYDTHEGHHVTWGMQVLVWVVIVVVVKLIVFYGFIIPLNEPLYAVGDFILAPVDEWPRTELVLVMVVIPTTLNIVQFWIQDNFLMYSPLGRKGRFARSGPDSSSSNAAPPNFDDDEEPEEDVTAAETDSLWSRSQRTSKKPFTDDD